MVQALNIDKDKYTERFFDRLNRRRTDKKYDFTILVGSQAILVERNILACGSDYFDAMLSHDTEERRSGKVEIHNADFESIKTCIDFIYRKDIEILPDNYDNLMLAADMMQLIELQCAIEQNMENNLSVQTLFNFRKIADTFRCEKLQNECQEFAENHFHEISKQNDFLEVDFQFLKNLVLSERSQINETGKLRSILNWVRHSVDTRNKRLLELLKCINLSKIHLTTLREYIHTEPLINTSNECLMLFCLSVIDTAKPPSNEPAPSASAAMIRQSEVLTLKLEAGSPALRIFNREDGIRSCLSTNAPAEFCQNHTLVELDHCIYSLGEDKSVYCLSFTDGAKWTRKPDLLESHGSRPPSASHFGCIFVVGGSLALLETAIEKFDPSTNLWQIVGQLPHQTSMLSVLSYGGCIYQFGGWEIDKWTNRVSRLNTSTMEWESLTRMRVKKGSVAATKYEHLIFVSGGISAHIVFNTFEQYDPAKDQWTTLPSMIMHRAFHRLHAIQGSLYAVGGSRTVKQDIEKYDLVKKEWTRVEHHFDSNIIIDSVMCECDNLSYS